MKTLLDGLLAMGTTVLLAACQPTSPPSTSVGDDACQASRFQHLVGTPAATLNRARLPDGTRILYPDTVATMDYRLERLNVHVDAQGNIVRVACG